MAVKVFVNCAGPVPVEKARAVQERVAAAFGIPAESVVLLPSGMTVSVVEVPEGNALPGPTALQSVPAPSATTLELGGANLDD